MVTVTRATATQLRLHSTIKRLPDTATQLWGTGHGRNDRYYRDARRSRLHSATAGSVRIRTRILGRLPALVKKRSAHRLSLPIKRPCRCVSVPAPAWG
jgi:hypothetical protein